MPEHVVIEDLLRFRDGEMSPTEIASLGRHLQECDRCAAFARDMFGDHEIQLFTHEPVSGPVTRNWILFAIAASLVIIAATLVVVWRERQSSQRPTSVVTQMTATVQQTTQTSASVPGEFEALIQTTLAERRIAAPALFAEVRPIAHGLRSVGGETPSILSPSNVVIEEQQPTMTWSTADPGPYVVTIFRGDREVAHSEPLTSRQWKSPALVRRATYVWQVRLPDGTLLPEPSAPRAIFAIADEATHKQLERARTSESGNHLLLGILYARAGMQAESEREFQQIHSGGAQAAAAKTLLESVRAW